MAVKRKMDARLGAHQTKSSDKVTITDKRHTEVRLAVGRFGDHLIQHAFGRRL